MTIRAGVFMACFSLSLPLFLGPALYEGILATLPQWVRLFLSNSLIARL